MRIPGLDRLKRLNLGALLRGLLKRVSPVPIIERMTETIMANIIKNFLVSALKSVLAAVVGGLYLFLNQPAPTDQVGAFVWTGVIAVAVRAAISAIERYAASAAK